MTAFAYKIGNVFRELFQLKHVRAVLVTTGLLAVSAQASFAHHTSIGTNAGLPIPSLTHGQMAVIADHRSEIIALADQQPVEDETLYRLRNFGDLQYLYCLWGMIPGSGDEESPFNECSHAYLSAAQALLIHMRSMPGDQSKVRALISKIELEMLLKNASLVLCRYSDEPFNTADVIVPRWGEVPFHLPSLITFLAVSVLISSGTVAAIRYLITPVHPVPIGTQRSSV